MVNSLDCFAEQGTKMAEAAEVDLVEIAPQAVLPVCRIMDYGKFKYTKARNARSQAQAKARSR